MPLPTTSNGYSSGWGRNGLFLDRLRHRPRSRGVAARVDRRNPWRACVNASGEETQS